MTKFWFKARHYGWGWTPASVEGWIVTVVLVLLLLASTVIFIRAVQSGAEPRLATLLFLVATALISGVAVVIAFVTGEPPRWRWGR
ncbi:MAG TPA: DUF3309 family protein [Stellaceae bacterium]|nr:DUF3309 family protein [Stellaceae bacterium]